MEVDKLLRTLQKLRLAWFFERRPYTACMYAAVFPRNCTLATFAEERSGFVKLIDLSEFREDTGRPLFERFR